ncbi:MAG: hypothetical protein JWO89_2188 [Verrucomicrobiaceae bacterium]|nr:hypothetical protein [Verrucomicrobiaceae bacterium]
MDNSFLIEEAYNQDAGAVQHIWTGAYGVNRMSGPDDRVWNLSFTQEWPFLSQTHQLSYTIPWAINDQATTHADGLGDVLLNYRYQLYFDEKTLTAFAPRLSFILPTGDAERRLGNDTFGYQVNLPFSTTLGDRWFFHTNSGFTWLPNAGPGPRKDLLDTMVGASVIYAATSRLHLMLEWTGTWQDRGPDAAGHDFVALISPGVRFAFNLPGDKQIVLGLAAPLGMTRAAPEYGIFLYASLEHPFARQPSASK